ncbi:ferrous iron transporter B [Candidatus Desantisbacteria bacterium CG2_30_40_21]|uniref:Ferrous iron transporter B n=4 Tax=unclassified Candidatus Desantisiibacteriota TaxID=3106372 RepID=A0A2M7JCX1_9BACT|nr:MAG: ferrous iron transporter B [Candidatus Desantisbacteria bacterium CG2_30_40_21]PIX17269.1 MAG: ferrous iron transporter B [Candidatus Desantisbacteria bacterium CG_4_8_14_3_um_filter_40_12]PIY18830.1 MAG: ferrous iron transporter B [Candidatus Desantisbacteria bacterium CG_4_10_14_3_um_filter_40_18]PJB30411.1 MAG: ferrous iron transporter B [Candidatus Desantisbacteria bacterium CG_4_9_14_3_um_filter_40_11]
MNILLMGNPNVGKSVVFSRLTGVHVISSNYPGTTVEFTKGYMNLNVETVEVIDVPGVYTLEPVSKAEEVACEMLNADNIVINVINSTNLIRSLNLTLQLIKKKIPMIIALNLWDEAEHTGIQIDAEKLQQILGVPCIPVCALTGEGFKVLVSSIKEASLSTYEYEEGERLHEAGLITESVEKITHRHHKLYERLRDATISPVRGSLIALIVLFYTFQTIRFIGEGLINYVFTPLFENLWTPLMLMVSSLFKGTGFIHDILIGRLIDGKIDYNQSFGLLTTGIFIEFGVVLPYIFAFFLILSFLEDSGYLPRLAILADNIMHRLGMHGMAIIPMMLGLGCNVPAVLSARVMDTKRERFIVTTLTAIAVPCMAQIAMVVGLLGKHGAAGLGIVFGSLFVVWIVLGIILNKVMSGESTEMFLEIPPYRFPYLPGLVKKVWMRITWFVREGVPWIMVGIFIANILYTLGIIDLIAVLAQPVVCGILGLPKEVAGALLIGFLRKDVAVGMLAPLGLTLPQLVISSVVLIMYFPCVASFSIMIKELGVNGVLKAAGIMIVSTLVVGGMLNLILSN